MGTRFCSVCKQTFDVEGDGHKEEACKDDCGENYIVRLTRKESGEQRNGFFSMKRFSRYDHSQRKLIVIEKESE